MNVHTPEQFVFHPYAVLRRGEERKWDGWYDLLKDGKLVRSFVRVPSREGFDDPALACEAAEILAQWDLDSLVQAEARH